MVGLSGREGLWAPDCVGLVITGNVFDRNGRKPNGDQPKYIWNANITINEASVDPSQSPTQNYLVCNNMITTSASQIAAIRVDAVTNTKAIVIRDNVLLGETSEIIVEGVAVDEVVLTGNGQMGGSK